MTDRDRLIETIACDISRGRSGNMSDRETAAMLLEIVELKEALALREEKMARDRAMRSG